MFHDLLQLASVIKYILIALGALGAVILIVGIVRREHMLTTRGGYMLVMAIVLWICGYFIKSVTEDKIQQKINDAFYEQSNY